MAHANIPNLSAAPAAPAQQNSLIAGGGAQGAPLQQQGSGMQPNVAGVRQPALMEINEQFFLIMGQIATRLNDFTTQQGNQYLGDVSTDLNSVANQGRDCVREAQTVTKDAQRQWQGFQHSVDDQICLHKKNYKLGYFKGDLDLNGKRDPLQCRDWLEAVGWLVTTYGLTEGTAINLMQLHAWWAFVDTITEALAEGSGYKDIVVQLETRFIGLRPPEQARDL